MPFVSQHYQIDEPIPAFLFLMRRFGLTQAKAQQLIGKKRLRVGGTPLRSTGEMIQGEVELVVFEPTPKLKAPLFRHKAFLVFEKPSGVLVHPKSMRSPYSMLDEIRYFGGADANAVHRIDQETSGLLLASANLASERKLKAMFEARLIAKTYLAWVRGKIEAPFEVSAPIAKNDDYTHTKHKVRIDPNGKEALTRFEPICYDTKHRATLLRCIPVTGRTHQIRIHLFHVKHPILGDPLYGTDFAFANRYLDGKLAPQERLSVTGAPRLLLHAQTLRFTYEGVKYMIESKEKMGLDF